MARTARRWGRGAGAVLLAGAVTLAGAAFGPAAGAAGATTCRTPWGSAAKSAQTSSVLTTTGVRAGRHACFDRIVVDGASSAKVRYVPQVVMDGSGDVVPLRGGARLQVLTTTGVDPLTGTPTFLPTGSRRTDVVPVSGFRTLRQVAWAGDFEGQLTLGVGVRARLPFRTFVVRTAGAPPKVVVDVAHRW